MSTGAELRDQGIERAADHAERVREGWKDMAFSAFHEYAKVNTDFTTEQVRLASPQVPEPPDKRAWGHVALRAAREGVVEKIGVVKAVNPKVHCMYVTLWGSRCIDLSARFTRDQWFKLARNYVRGFRMAVKREGFVTAEVWEYAAKLSAPMPDNQLWWAEAIAAEGLEFREGGWRPKACCPECAEGH